MTIRNMDAFNRALPAGFDGVFDWDWMKGCFSNPKIEPMDFDAVVERNGQFLVFETKDAGKGVPRGQMITLRAFHKLGCATVILLQGKSHPERGRIWWPGADISDEKLGHEFIGLEGARGLVRSWWLKADTGAPF